MVREGIKYGATFVAGGLLFGSLVAWGDRNIFDRGEQVTEAAADGVSTASSIAEQAGAAVNTVPAVVGSIAAGQVTTPESSVTSVPRQIRLPLSGVLCAEQKVTVKLIAHPNAPEAGSVLWSIDQAIPGARTSSLEVSTAQNFARDVLGYSGIPVPTDIDNVPLSTNSGNISLLRPCSFEGELIIP